MKYYLLVGAGLLALFFAAQPAAAADMPRPVAKAPAMVAAPMFNWTGFYIGVNAGYGWGDPAVAINGLGGPAWDPYYPDPFRPRKFDRDGFIGGAQLGWNQQFNNVVLGLEADIQYSRIGGSLATSGPGPGDPYDLLLRQDLDWLATARGRIGVTFSPLLIYATAGLAGGKVSATSNLGFPVTQYDVSGAATKWGWTVGGGVEIALQGNWSAKTEYLYYDLGTLSLIANPAPPNPPFQTRTDFEVRGHIVRAGINYRFATGKTPAPVMTRY